MTNSFTTFYPHITNILSSEIFVSPYDPIYKPTDKLPQTAKKYNAIWDTGATNSVITEKIVQDLNLNHSGFSEVMTADGKIRERPFYYVSMFLPNNVTVELIRATSAPNIGPYADILVGMDIVSIGDLAISNYQGKTVFSFRAPSQGITDYANSHDKT